jgi:predicted MFS family arabinose efflux permease
MSHNPAPIAAEAARAAAERVTTILGGARRARVITVLAAVLGLSGADVATVGASATELRHALSISDTQIGLLVATTLLVGALATIPFGMLADRVRRTTTLAVAVGLWGAAMAWSAAASDYEVLLAARIFLGIVTAAAGPLIASLVGDYFDGGERGRTWGFILTGELLGVGFGFVVTGDIAVFSWRAAFVVLAIPAFALAWLVARLPEPERGGGADDGAAGMSLTEAARHVLRVRTNTLLIASSSLGYYFLAGLQTFGAEFAKKQYGVNQAEVNVLVLIVGVGALAGVLAGGAAGDLLMRRGRVSARVTVAAVTAALAAVLFVPAVLSSGAFTALPYLIAAAFMLAGQNPPLDAARLDVMPARLWGRAEAVRTVVRSLAQAMAPLLFGIMSDRVFGGGRSGLQWTFLVMLLPLAGSAAILWRARATYPGDAAAAGERSRARPRAAGPERVSRSERSSSGTG